MAITGSLQAVVGVAAAPKQPTEFVAKWPPLVGMQVMDLGLAPPKLKTEIRITIEGNGG